MIYYKAVCRLHGWESSLFLTRASAISSARAHRNNVDGPHDISIMEVFIDANSLEIRSEMPIL